MALGSNVAAEARSFGIGTVLSTGFDAVWRNIVPFAVSAFVIGGMEGVFGAWFKAHPIHAASRTVRVGDASLYILIELVAYTLLLAVIAQGTLQDLRQRKASIRDGFEAGFSALPRLLPAGLLLLSPLWLMIVLILCIGHPIPWLQEDAEDLSISVIFIGSWMVVPVAVAERAGIIGMFGRSWALSAGHRWQVLAIPLLTPIAAILVLALVSAKARRLGVSSDTVFFIGFWCYSVIGSALSAAAYHLLLIEKEGTPAESVGDVFD
jgi:hypothetical protein